MKFAKIICFGIAMANIVSCTVQKTDQIAASAGSSEGQKNFSTWLDYVRNAMPAEQRRIMPYDNKYKDNPMLAGIEVYQLPVVDNTVEDYSCYIGMHPGAIIYHFWDGRILWIHYAPDGKIIDEEWSRHPTDPLKIKSGREYVFSWEMVDFSKGSDPDFKHHKDPRDPPGHGLYP